MDFDLAGHSVVITGASRGIGRALAVAFASQGADLGLVARDRAALTELTTELPTRTVTAECDVTDAASVESAFAEIGTELGGVDTVVANAGISLDTRRVHNLRPDTWQRVIDVNLTGAFYTARAAHAFLAKAEAGRVIFVSSVMARLPRHGVSAYAASKSGLEGLTRAAAADWAVDGITVNAVALGFFDLGMGQILESRQDYRDQVTRRIPTGRIGTADDLTHPVLFLASAAARYVNGQVVAVDGGYALD